MPRRCEASLDCVSAGSVRPLRVAHISTVHSAMDGRVFFREAQTLARLGVDVTVVAVHEGDTECRGVAIRGLPAEASRLRRMLLSWWRGLQAIRCHRADVYQLHDPELIPAGLLAKWWLRKRVLFDAHEGVTLIMQKPWVPDALKGPVQCLAGLLDHLAARCLDGIVVPTRLLHEKYRRWTSRVVMFVNYPAPSFVDRVQEAWRPFEERRNEVVHLGTVSPRRLEFMMTVAERFLRCRPDWSWTLLGMHPELLSRFQQRVPASLAGRLRGTDQVPHMEVADRLCGAKIGINYHPLDYAHIQIAIPVKVFEYLACGLPTVTTRVPLLAELVEDCPSVALVDEDPDAFLEGLETLAARQDLEGLSREARRFSDERFNCLNEARKLLDLYGQVTGWKA